MTFPQAQVYCRTLYQNGSLCGFKSNATLMEAFDAVNAKPNTFYWTGRDQKDSSRPIANSMSRYLGNENCYGAMYGNVVNETKIKLTARSCCDAQHFICQTTEADPKNSGMYFL